MTEVTLIRGDATGRWPLPDNSLDSIVTDPPYGIAFMGKKWDDVGGPQAYQEWTQKWASEAFRCLKPGGFLLAFGSTRMVHRMACGIEDAGFRIVDTIEWLYLSGFPKAQDIGKMFDKRAGAEREKKRVPYTGNAVMRMGGQNTRPWMEEALRRGYHELDGDEPVTDLAKQWDGWKTPALKPAHEPIVLAQKPLEGTYCDNIEKWGVGAINVDGCRIPGPSWVRSTPWKEDIRGGNFHAENGYNRIALEPQAVHPEGRYPANMVLSHGPFCTAEACMDGCPVKVLDELSGIKISRRSRRGVGLTDSPVYGRGRSDYDSVRGHDDVGGASKIFAKFFYEEADFVPFYYCPKPSAKERNAGLEDLPPVSAAEITGRKPGSPGLVMEGGRANPYAGIGTFRRNYHPTVKPLKLVRYLQRLVTPPGGITASPFLGSGTDAVAAILEGFNFWGMELSDEYWPIIEARVAWAREQVKREASRPVVEQARLSL